MSSREPSPAGVSPDGAGVLQVGLNADLREESYVVTSYEGEERGQTQGGPSEDEPPELMVQDDAAHQAQYVVASGAPSAAFASPRSGRQGCAAGETSQNDGEVSQGLLAGQSSSVIVKRPKVVKSGSAIDVSNMPEAIRDILQEVAGDDGMLDKQELVHAMARMKHDEHKINLFRRAVIVLTVFIVLLLGGMFALSIIAGELVKEMKTNGSTLVTKDGEVVKVSSSDFTVNPDGTLKISAPFKRRRRLDARRKSGRRLDDEDEEGEEDEDGDEEDDEDDTIKVSTNSVPHKLTSTMGSDTYKELQKITLKNPESAGDEAVVVQVSGFRRQQLRTSKCGSVVRLETPHGVITIDDTEIRVDEQFAEYLKGAGLGELLHGDTLQALGRRLTAAAMLTGFFNSIPASFAECTSAPLEKPEAIKTTFAVSALMKMRMESQDQKKSTLFKDEDGNPLLLPGVELKDGVYYQNWEEEAIGGVFGISLKKLRYGMYPMTDFVKLNFDDDQYTALLAMESNIAVNCSYDGQPIMNLTFTNSDDETKKDFEKDFPSDEELDPATSNGTFKDGNFTMANSTNGTTAQQKGLLKMPDSDDDDEDAAFLEFVDLVEMDSMILRHFRMNLLGLLENESIEAEGAQANQSEIQKLMRQGSLPDMYDYYDVDTDPSGNRAAGTPYRRVSWSTVPSSNVYTEATYLTVEALSDNYTVADALERFGVRKARQNCFQELGLEYNDSVAYQYGQISQMSDVIESLDEVEAPKRPLQLPPVESLPGVDYQRKMLLQLESDDEAMEFAMMFDYWKRLLVSPDKEIEDLLESGSEFEIENATVEEDEDNDDAEDDNDEEGGDDGDEDEDNDDDGRRLPGFHFDWDDTKDPKDIIDGQRRLATGYDANGTVVDSRRLDSRRRMPPAGFGPSCNAGKKICFNVDFAPDMFELSFSIPASRGRQLSFALGVEFPNNRLEQLYIGAGGPPTILTVPCPYGICLLAEPSGEVRFVRGWQEGGFGGEVTFGFSLGPVPCGIPPYECKGKLHLADLVFGAIFKWMNYGGYWSPELDNIYASLRKELSLIQLITDATGLPRFVVETVASFISPVTAEGMAHVTLELTPKTIYYPQWKYFHYCGWSVRWVRWGWGWWQRRLEWYWSCWGRWVLVGHIEKKDYTRWTLSMRFGFSMTVKTHFKGIFSVVKTVCSWIPGRRLSGYRSRRQNDMEDREFDDEGRRLFWGRRRRRRRRRRWGWNPVKAVVGVVKKVGSFLKKVCNSVVNFVERVLTRTIFKFDFHKTLFHLPMYR